ncbi:replicative DNA helicase [Chlamydia trachomatis]|uniref:Probable plasmid replicative DNA helicase n=8 Tax=Chlamydia trachomatis TaxID=813 RepID=GP1D_CHLT2|nr:replicative DNA helicase [Chlamydia trachomatis]B0BCM3.1 RecName: Full=Probable plasmid replicative DNA helicase; AltName: Full=DnaB-like protein; AltName: Full=Protein P-3; AltName: Full=Virulence plasmid protein pGP1-D [Chlamydia trachomatis 434/Bu]P0CE16.1 RecName: Full=Probable plasmid replicative DNA helicase; AltName: Full=DnaB-like protein; AltName: Full=Protein P-3; AltName: Full=Virulence plasmid protein pGP1-D [Chlamydia trachomatis]AGJ65019.1 DNA helicase [Chlamydia trachomatis L2/
MKTRSEIENRMQDIEYALLGKALIFEDSTEYILRQLANYEFKCSHHKNIFIVFKYLKDNGLPITVDSAWEELLRRRIKDMDKSYLGLMLHDALSNDKLRSVSHTVFLDDLSVCSAEENLSNFIFRSFNEYNENPLRRSPFLLLERIKGRLDSAIAKTFSIRSARGRSIYDIFSQSEIGVLARIKKRRATFSENQNSFFDAFPTGYKDIDDKGVILAKGNFVIIAARPSIGKTALAIDMAINLAVTQQRRVGFLSLEMSAGQIVERIIANLTGISGEKLQRGDLSKEELFRVEEAGETVRESHFYICSDSQYKLNLIANQIRLLRKEDRVDVIFIDYLQLINSSVGENRQNEIADISRTLRGLASELNIPIVCLSQLSRKVEDRANKVPMLSDLRDSGQIEQDADVILFINRKESSSNCEITVGKNRHGSVFSSVLHFDPKISKFSAIKKVW